MAHSFRIAGLGTALPSRGVSQKHAARAIERLTRAKPGLLTGLFQQTRIENRHFALPEDALNDLFEGTSLSGSCFVPTPDGDPNGPSTEQRMATYATEAPKLAIQAARAALADAAIDPRRITHVVVVTCTGFDSPGVDFALIQELKMHPTVQRVQVGFMGCHGAINGLRVLHGLTAANPNACVLMVAVEMCSLHFRYRPTRDGTVANALFADGAAALIGTAEKTGAIFLQDTGSLLFPNTTQAMSWKVGNYGFDMTLSPRIPKLIASEMRPWLEAWLGERDLRIEDVANWVIHPGGPKILDSVESSLELSEMDLADSRTILAQCGNMSSPTILFILDRLRARKATGPCIMLGFGPGLVAEIALLHMTV